MRLGKKLDSASHRGPEIPKSVVLLLIPSLPTDPRQARQGRQGTLGMELRRVILRSSRKRQLRCLSPPRSHLPRSIPSWRQHPRIM